MRHFFVAVLYVHEDACDELGFFGCCFECSPACHMLWMILWLRWVAEEGGVDGCDIGLVLFEFLLTYPHI